MLKDRRILKGLGDGNSSLTEFLFFPGKIINAFLHWLAVCSGSKIKDLQVPGFDVFI